MKFKIKGTLNLSKPTKVVVLRIPFLSAIRQAQSVAIDRLMWPSDLGGRIIKVF